MAWLTERYGEEGVMERFGRPICSDDVAAKILWVKNREPEVYSRAAKFLTGSSYITAKLTGNYVIDQFLAKAAFRPLYRADGSIDEAECALFCRPDQLAECRTVTELAGFVTGDAARETGLAPGTPVITGSGDSTSEAVSVGIVEPGDVMFQFGSSLFYYYCAGHEVRDPRVHAGNYNRPRHLERIRRHERGRDPHPLGAGQLFPELVEAEAAGGRNAYSAMMDYLPESSEGLVCLPYHAGERMPINDPDAKGVLFGLKLGHGRGHIYRAALEGVACSLWQNVRLMEDAGLPVAAVTAVGGGTKNPAWMQITADVSGKRILVPAVTVGASYGDALMAAVGTGPPLRLRGAQGRRKARPRLYARPGRARALRRTARGVHGALSRHAGAHAPPVRELRFPGKGWATAFMVLSALSFSAMQLCSSLCADIPAMEQVFFRTSWPSRSTRWCGRRASGPSARCASSRIS